MAESGGQTNITFFAGGIAVEHAFSENKCAVYCSFYNVLINAQCKKKEPYQNTASTKTASNLYLFVPNITERGTVASHNLFHVFYTNKGTECPVIKFAVD